MASARYKNMGYRVGFGFDVHRFSRKKKRLVLGGKTIPGGPGLHAVSDGDVVLHAVCDAILESANSKKQVDVRY